MTLHLPDRRKNSEYHFTAGGSDMLCRKLFRGRLSVAGGLSKCIRRKYEDRADGELWHRNGCLHAGNALFGY